jgi:hypothetical protein
MRYGVRMEFPGLTQEQYDGMHAIAMSQADAATGFVAHLAGPTANGWYILEVWDSKEDQQRFTQMIMSKMPPGGPQPHVEEFQVYSWQTSGAAVT